MGRILDRPHVQLQAASCQNPVLQRIAGSHPDLRAAQRKPPGRLYDARPGEIAGGLSTEKYVHLTGVSRATAYRELTDLTERGLLERTGQGRGTRYRLVG